jgi:hypothetical membrane protein
LYLSFAAFLCLPFAVDALDQVLLALRRQVSQLLVVEMLWRLLGIAHAATVARLCESILWFLCCFMGMMLMSLLLLMAMLLALAGFYVDFWE